MKGIMEIQKGLVGKDGPVMRQVHAIIALSYPPAQVSMDHIKVARRVQLQVVGRAGMP